MHGDNVRKDMSGFRETKPCDGHHTKANGVFALDCEMIYTWRGIELARVTVVDRRCALVYDQLVVPQTPILDYNTRLVGIDRHFIL